MNSKISLDRRNVSILVVACSIIFVSSIKIFSGGGYKSNFYHSSLEIWEVSEEPTDSDLHIKRFRSNTSESGSRSRRSSPQGKPSQSNSQNPETVPNPKPASIGALTITFYFHQTSSSLMTCLEINWPQKN